MKISDPSFVNNAEQLVLRAYYAPRNTSIVASEAISRLAAIILLSPSAAIDCVSNTLLMLPTSFYALAKSVYLQQADFTLPCQHIQRVRNAIKPLLFGSACGLLHPFAGLGLDEGDISRLVNLIDPASMFTLFTQGNISEKLLELHKKDDDFTIKINQTNNEELFLWLKKNISSFKSSEDLWNFMDLFSVIVDGEAYYPFSFETENKRNEAAELFWCKSAENYISSPLDSANLLFLAFPNFKPTLKLDDDNDTIMLYADYYSHKDKRKYPDNNEILKILFSDRNDIDINSKQALAALLNQELLFSSILEGGGEIIPKLLMLGGPPFNFRIILTPEMEQIWIEKIQKGEVEEETCVNLCKLHPILKVGIDNIPVVDSKFAGFAASKIFKEHTKSVESIQSLAYWPTFFQFFGEVFGDLNLSIQRALYRNPQANTFCLPSEDDPYLQEIYNEAKIIFDKLSTDAACLFPKLSLNKKALGSLGGFCKGATLHIAKDILMRWNNESIDELIKTVGQKYTTRVTKEAFITHIAYNTIRMENLHWNNLLESIYQSLSSTNTISRITTLFLIITAYGISQEKIEFFINKHSLDAQDSKIMKELFISDEIKQLSTSAVLELEDKGCIDETPFSKLMQKIGIGDSDIELIKNHIYSCYSIKQMCFHSDSKAIYLYKKVSSCATEIFNIFNEKGIKERSACLKSLYKSIGLDCIKYSKSKEKRDEDILEEMFNYAEDGVYMLKIQSIMFSHVICLVKKNGLMYMIDPNGPLSNGEPDHFKAASDLIEYLSINYPSSPEMINHCCKLSKITLDQSLL